MNKSSSQTGNAMPLVVASVCLALSSILTNTLSAASYSWNQDTVVSADWSTPGNWSPSGPPPSGANGVILNLLSSATNPIVYNTGSTTTLSASSTLGDAGGEGGYLTINSGILDFSGGTTSIGKSGTGVVTVNSGATLKKEAGSLALGTAATGSGIISVHAGGVFTLTNGNATYSVGGSGSGTINIFGGAMTFSNTTARIMNVGTGTGMGMIDIRGGSISAQPSTGKFTLNIGYSASSTGNGTLVGYGTVSLLNSAATPVGAIQVGGEIIGDGTQVDLAVADHTLNITSGSLTTADNAYGATTFGFYTSNRGAISLPPQSLAASAANFFWGDDHTSGNYWTIGNASASNPKVLVNSAFLHRSSTGQAVTVKGSLLDPTRTTAASEAGSLPANGTGQAFLNVWQFDVSVGPLNLDEFSVRYDASTGTNGAGNYGPITGLYYWNGTGAWQDLSANTSIDTVNSLVNYNGMISIPAGSSGYFALAATSRVSPFGVSMSNSSRNSFASWASPIAATGVQWTRGFLTFNAIEPAEGTFVWTGVDTQLGIAAANNLNVMGMFYLNAGWINSNKETFPTANLPAWATYVDATVNHCKNQVHKWEVWNEPPNFSSSGTATDYAVTVVAAYDAAKAADPACEVGLAAKSTHINWLEQTILAGAADHFDFITLHPYEIMATISDGCEGFYMGIVPSVRKMLAARNPSRAGAPVWFTEIGEKVGHINGTVTVTENIQGGDLVKAYAMGIAQGVECITWFEGKDGDSGEFGLMTSTGFLRPAYSAMSNMIAHLGAHPIYLGWVLLNNKDYGFVFQGATTTVMTAWAPPATTDTVSFGQVVQIVNPLTGAVTNASTYPLTNTPILVVGVPASILAQAQGNRTQPFPWLGGDHTNATSVSATMGAPNTESGLHHVFADADSTAITAYGGPARDCSKALNQSFMVDPTFLSYTATPVTITVVVRRNEANDLASLNLQYESVTGLKAAPGGQWTIPGNTQWYTKSWTVTDPQFVGKYAYNFLLTSTATNKKYYLQSVTVSK